MKDRRTERGRTEGRKDERTKGRKDGRTVGKERRKDGKKEGRKERWKEGGTYRLFVFVSSLPSLHSLPPSFLPSFVPSFASFPPSLHFSVDVVHFSAIRGTYKLFFRFGCFLLLLRVAIIGANFKQLDLGTVNRFQ